MAPRVTKTGKKRRRIESGYLLILSGLVFLGVAALLVIDSRDRVRGPERTAHTRPETVGSGIPAPEEDARAMASRIGTIPGADTRTLDTLVRPVLLEIALRDGQGGFLRDLERVCVDAGWKILSRGDLGDARRLRFSLGRNEPELVLVLHLPARSQSLAHKGPNRVVSEGRSNRRPRIALVLDDAGGEAALQWLFLEIPVRLNFAVIPGLPNSHSFAKRARAAGHQVLIHLPMQPRAGEKTETGSGVVQAGMSSRDIERILDRAVRSVPGAVAVNNHMGSLATADRSLMRLLMPAIRQRGLLFLDSKTHASSVAASEADRAGLPILVRDIFLDHVQKRTYIEDALRSLVREAAGKGFAIGIGHVTCMETWQVLRDELKKIAEIGVDFVGITELE